MKGGEGTDRWLSCHCVHSDVIGQDQTECDGMRLNKTEHERAG